MKQQDTAAFTSGYSDVNGIKMYYEIHGKGEIPLVLIHGGGSTIGTTFGNILPLLAAHYKVIAVEMQAHGHTGDRDAPETFQQDAEDIATLLKNLNVTKANFFGFSNGGQTLFELANRHPQIINKLIIASTFYKRSGAAFPGFFEGMASATLDQMPKPYHEAFLAIKPNSNLLYNMFNKDRNRMMNFKDWSDDALRSIQAPTLILSGDHDVATNEHTVLMSKLIPHAQLAILPGTHGSYFGELLTAVKGSKMTEITAGLVREFLGE